MGGTFCDIAYYFDPTLPDVGMVDISAVTGSVFAGSQAVAFWLGTVVVGVVAPLALTWFAKRVEGKTLVTYGGVALVCAVVGSLCWRCILYAVAISIFPLY